MRSCRSGKVAEMCRELITRKTYSKRAAPRLARELVYSSGASRDYMREGSPPSETQSPSDCILLVRGSSSQAVNPEGSRWRCDECHSFKQSRRNIHDIQWRAACELLQSCCCPQQEPSACTLLPNQGDRRSENQPDLVGA
jgi:hypothetical protein